MKKYNLIIMLLVFTACNEAKTKSTKKEIVPFKAAVELKQAINKVGTKSFLKKIEKDKPGRDEMVNRVTDLFSSLNDHLCKPLSIRIHSKMSTHQLMAFGSEFTFKASTVSVGKYWRDSLELVTGLKNIEDSINSMKANEENKNLEFNQLMPFVTICRQVKSVADSQ